MRMLNGNILTKEIAPESKTISGIIIPDNTKKPYKKLKVVKMEGKVEGVSEGSVVYVPERSGFGVTLEDTSYTIINQREIILIL